MLEQETESKLPDKFKVEAAETMKEPVKKTSEEAAPAAHPEKIVVASPFASRESAAQEKSEAAQKTAAPGPVAMPEKSTDKESPVSRAEFDKIKDERDQMADRLARLQAEFENARKRAERERASDRDYATANVVKQFLPVLDNFELALKSDGAPEQLRSGVELIRKQMEDVLRQLHVHAIPAVGAEFDPRQHEALGTVERDDLPDQHVAEEIRRGYKLRDRLLRPALVRVASNPKQTVASKPKQTSE
jgi:molecular chaperone GrpE